MEDLRYDYAKEIYKIECDRENNLNNKSQIYLSLITIIISSLLFNIKDLFELLETESIKQNQCINSVLIIVIILSTIGIIFLFTSIKINKYKKPSAVTDLMSNYLKPEIDNEQFVNERSLDLLIATDHNKIINDKKADFLEYSLVSILLSYLFSLVFILQVIMSDNNTQKQKELEEKQRKEQYLKEYLEKQKANQLKVEKRSKN